MDHKHTYIHINTHTYRYIYNILSVTATVNHRLCAWPAVQYTYSNHAHSIFSHPIALSISITNDTTICTLTHTYTHTNTVKCDRTMKWNIVSET